MLTILKRSFSTLNSSVQTMRYFPNPYRDYDGSDVQVNSDIWLNLAKNTANVILSNIKHVESSIDGGLYVGPAGVAYALWKLSSFVTPTEASHVLAQADNLIKLNLMYVQRPDLQRDKQNKVGFLLGASGVQAVATAIANAKEDKSMVQINFQKFCQIIQEGVLGPGIVHHCGSDELFVGRAGYLAGALWLNQVFKQDIINPKDLYAICDGIVLSGQAYVQGKSSKKQSMPPLMYSYYDTEYLGAAHGLCAILQMLLSVPGYYEQCSAKDDIKQSVNFLLQMQTSSGNFPCAMDEAPPYRPRPESEDLVHWCHGAPGMIYLLVKAYLLFKEDKYLQGALNCGECVWNKGLLKKGPGICHGVAGSGYVFLVLFRVTQDRKHLYRAQKFGEFLESDIFRNNARQPDCPLSLYEGLAGTLCYLLDLSKPEESHFPFSDVF